MTIKHKRLGKHGVLVFNPAVTTPTIGPHPIEQLESAVQGASIELHKKTLQKLDAIFLGPSGGVVMTYTRQ